jgi:microcystin-dependent protein
MAEPFLSEIRMMSFGFPPKGWALCDGQLLPINQNQALLSLLGTTYGGDGRVNFGLPNLQGRVPIHMGNSHTLGELRRRAGPHAEHLGNTHAYPCHAGLPDRWRSDHRGE